MDPPPPSRFPSPTAYAVRGDISIMAIVSTTSILAPFLHILKNTRRRQCLVLILLIRNANLIPIFIHILSYRSCPSQSHQSSQIRYKSFHFVNQFHTAAPLPVGHLVCCDLLMGGIALEVLSTDSPSGFLTGFFNTSSRRSSWFYWSRAHGLFRPVRLCQQSRCWLRCPCPGRFRCRFGSHHDIRFELALFLPPVVAASVVSVGIACHFFRLFCLYLRLIASLCLSSELGADSLHQSIQLPTMQQPRTASRRSIRSFSFIDHASS